MFFQAVSCTLLSDTDMIKLANIFAKIFQIISYDRFPIKVYVLKYSLQIGVIQGMFFLLF